MDYFKAVRPSPQIRHRRWICLDHCVVCRQIVGLVPGIAVWCVLVFQAMAQGSPSTSHHRPASIIHHPPLTRGQPHTVNYGLADGLPSLAVYQLQVDARERLWASTNAGPVLFTGKAWQPVPLLGARTTAVDDLAEDAEGIWCNNFSSQVFRLHNDTFRLAETPGLSRLIQMLVLPATGRLCLITEKLLWFRTATGTWHTEAIPDTANLFASAILDQHGQLMLCTQGGSVYRRTASGVFQVVVRLPAGYDRLLPRSISSDGFWAYNHARPSPLLQFDSLSPIQAVEDQPVLKRPIIRYIPDKAIATSDATRHAMVVTEDGAWWVEHPPSGPARWREHFFPGQRITDAVPVAGGGWWFSTIGQGVLFQPNRNIRVFGHDSGETADRNIASVAAGPAGKALMRAAQPNWTPNTAAGENCVLAAANRFGM